MTAIDIQIWYTHECPWFIFGMNKQLIEAFQKGWFFNQHKSQLRYIV